jgi:hypothetical protein
MKKGVMADTIASSSVGVDKRREPPQNHERAEEANLWIKEVPNRKHGGTDGETQRGCGEGRAPRQKLVSKVQ